MMKKLLAILTGNRPKPERRIPLVPLADIPKTPVDPPVFVGGTMTGSYIVIDFQQGGTK